MFSDSYVAAKLSAPQKPSYIASSGLRPLLGEDKCQKVNNDQNVFNMISDETDNSE